MLLVVLAVAFSKRAKPKSVRRRWHTHEFLLLALDLIIRLNCHKSPETPPWRRTDDEEIMADDGGHGADGQELLENAIAEKSGCNNNLLIIMSALLITSRIPVTLLPHRVICAAPCIAL